jgi:hypothetical protein
LGCVALSSTAQVTVNAALVVTVSPTSVTMDVGQSQTFNLSILGGTSPYSYQWYQNGTAIGGATGSTYVFGPSSRGHYNFYVVVTDSATPTANTATSSTVTAAVNSAPSVGISPTSVTMDVGQSQTFTSSASGGTGSYSYQWYLDGGKVSGATGASWTYVPSSSSVGLHSVYVNVTDSLGCVALSSTAQVTVNAALVVTVSPTSVTMDVGQSQTFTSSASGGTDSFVYQWYLEGSAVSGAADASWTFTPSLTGSYTVYLAVTDTVDAVATSNTAQVTVNAALVVTVSPTSVTMDVGQSQTFTSSASGGTGPSFYQWYLNGTLVSGVTSATWTFAPSTSAVYNVSAVVTDSASVPMVAQSNAAYVTVYPHLAVSVGPSSSTIYQSQNQTFASSVSGGAAPYKYQWYENRTLVSGATSWNWTFTPTSTGNSTRVYLIYVSVTDDVGQIALSPYAQLTVRPKPPMYVTISPTAAKLDLDQSVSFTSSGNGGLSPFTYQWYVNGSAMSNADSMVFTPASTGVYQVWLNVTDSLNTGAKSNIASLTVSSHPSVSNSPPSVVMDAGQPQTFMSSVANGTSPYSYQWYLDDSPVLGANGSSWTYTPSSAGNHTVYLTVRDSASITATSNSVSVTVNAAPYVIIVPKSITMDVGQSQQFSSTVSGGKSPYSYQWYLDDSPVLGANGSSWTYTPSSAGNHTLQLDVTDAANVTTISNSVPVTVKGPLSVTILPTDVTLDVGQSQIFTPTISGGASPFTYKWYQNSTQVATSATYTFAASSTGFYKVYVKVTDSASSPCTASSNIVLVTVNQALTIGISAPHSMDVGQTQTFTATVSGGTSPFYYQWYLNGVAVSGATSSIWTFTPTSPGTYTVYVIVTDSASVDPSVQSSSFQFTVNAAPTVAITPTSAAMNVGMSITFKSSISGGTSPYSYQWYLNGSPVSGATYSTWNFSEPMGSYTVYLNVTDNAGEKAKSNIASVTEIATFTVAITPPSTSITVGSSVSFTSIVSGGVAPYYYQWYMNGLGVLGAENPTWTFSPASPGTYNIYLNVTGSNGTTAKSNVAQVTVTLIPAPHAVGGVSAPIITFSFLAQWISIVSVLAAAMLLEGIIVKKKRR